MLKERLKTVYNTELRDDSRIAFHYALNLPESELDNICKELWYLKLLYTYTNYGNICSQANLNQIKYNIMKDHEWYPYSSQRAWHIQTRAWH